MKRSLVAFILYIATSGYANCEPLVVRSGEHEDFTRLVLPLPENANWNMENSPGRSKVVFTGFNDGFDLSYAFEIIPRTRLKALVARPSELILQMSCDCAVTTFIERSSFLVIDIFDGPPFDTTLNEPPAITSLPSSSFSYGELLWSGGFASSGSYEGPENEESDEQYARDLRSENINRQSEIASSTQQRLLEGFSRAASRGLITPKQNLPRGISHTETAERSIAIHDSSEIAQEIALSSAGHIRITNSKDLPESAPFSDIGSSGATCPDPDLFDVSNWGSDADFGLQIAQSTLDTFDALGRVETDQVLNHARLYVFFGFGAEAKQALKMVPNLLQENPELGDLADIMEFGYAREPERLSPYTDCNSRIALWAMLADRNISKDQAIDAEAALRALNILPSHLKFSLAKILSNRFLEMGDPASAKIALRVFERLEESPSKNSGMANAKIAELQNEKTGFKEMLNEMVENQTPESPIAISALVQNHVDQNTAVPAELALLAESYAFEFKNTELGLQMLRTFILAAIKSAQFEKIFEFFKNNEQAQAFDQAMRSELVSFAFSEFTQITGDGDFIKGIFFQLPNFDLDLSSSVVVEISTRMLELGFNEQATFLVSRVSPEYQANSLSILKAKLFFLSKQYLEAQAELEGIDGPEVAKLRAEIFEMLGNNESAASYFEEANMPERAISSLWLSDEWSEVISESTPIFGVLSKLNKEEAIEFRGRQNMLRKSQEAISSSMTARLAMENALNRLEIETPN